MTAPIMLITGTDTEVGKTIATAAIAAALRSQGLRVAVIKPTQTGLQPGEPGDVDEVKRLAGNVETFEFVRLPDPLAPDAAARRAQVDLPTIAAHASRVQDIAESDEFDTVLVEGAGGLLVHLDGEGGTLADLGRELGQLGLRAGFVLVVGAGLGTLNATALTAEALDRRHLDLIGYIIGSYPAHPDLAEQENITDLPTAAHSNPLGKLPEGASGLEPQEFQRLASTWVHL